MLLASRNMSGTLFAEPNHCAFFPSASGDWHLCRCKYARPTFIRECFRSLSAWLAQNGIRCRKHRLILVIRKPSQEMANPPEGLTQKQIGSELVRGRRTSIALRRLKLGIMTTEHAG